MEWIDVKSQLPDPYSTVIVWNGMDSFMAIWIEEKKRFEDEQSGIYNGITHWMPRPEGPKDLSLTELIDHFNNVNPKI